MSNERKVQESITPNSVMVWSVHERDGIHSRFTIAVESASNKWRPVAEWRRLGFGVPQKGLTGKEVAALSVSFADPEKAVALALAYARGLNIPYIEKEGITEAIAKAEKAKAEKAKAEKAKAEKKEESEKLAEEQSEFDKAKTADAKKRLAVALADILPSLAEKVGTDVHALGALAELIVEAERTRLLGGRAEAMKKEEPAIVQAAREAKAVA